MLHGARAGAKNRWVAAGMPTIPGHWYPFVIAARYDRKQAEQRERAQAVADSYAKSQEKKGWLNKAAGAVSRFFQRRRA